MTDPTVPQLLQSAPTSAALTPYSERDAFELAQRKAKVYAASSLVPQQYIGSVPNCLIALNMAKRIGADELMVMQNLHIVNGRPGWSGQFLIATFNQCGRFSAMRFEQRGSIENKKEWAYRAWATEKATGERIDGPWITWAMVEAEGWNKRNGSKWLTMPDLMFHYRAGAFLVRTHAPEIAMGLPTVEELKDVIELDATDYKNVSKTEALTSALRNSRTINADTGEMSMRDTESDATADAAAGVVPADATRTNGSDVAQPRREFDVPVTYAQVAAAIERAKSADILDIAEDLIRGVHDEKHHAELWALATAKRKTISETADER